MKEKNNPIRLFFPVFLALSALAFISCTDGPSIPVNEWTVTFLVTAKNNFGTEESLYGVEYSDETGERLWDGTHHSSPWSYTFRTTRRQLPLYVKAIAMPFEGPFFAQYRASVSVRVYVNGKLRRSDTDSREAVIEDVLDRLL